MREGEVNTVADHHQRIVEKIEFGKYRNLKNKYIKIIFNVVLSLIPIIGILFVLQFHQTIGWMIYNEQFIGLFFSLVLFCVYIGVPFKENSPKDRVPWYDWILALLGLSVGLYLFLYYPEIMLTMGSWPLERVIMAIIAVILVLEASRRLFGIILTVIVGLFIVYGFVSPYMPGIFRGVQTDPARIITYLYIDPSSIISMLNLAATVGLVFIFFGQVLLYFGGAEILNKLALSTFGRFRGGAAKGSIIGSSMVGTVTGNPVTNVLLTGSVTIPLMKKNGFSSVEAGAIEAVSSTGGQIMPPVMGIAAFMIADALGIPYAEVAIAALIPALLYYLCLFFQVDLISGLNKMSGLNKGEIPLLRTVLKEGWMIFPAFLSLIYFLFIAGYTPQKSGIYASVIAAIFLFLQKNMLPNFLDWRYVSRLCSRVFVDSGKMTVEITVVLAAAGLVMGVTGITGLGFNIGMMLSSFAHYGLLVLLIVSAVVCIILGMGMPAVAAYALVAVLVAPSIVSFGIDPLAAHLFVFYFSILSNFTPPIAVCCFTAAPIARENPHRIGIKAMQLGLVAYIVPFMFIYAPELLIRAEQTVPTLTMIISIGSALVACYFTAITVVGYLFQKINAYKRIFTALIAIGLFLPLSIWELSWIVNSVAFVLAVLFVLNELRIMRKTAQISNTIYEKTTF